MNASAAVCLCYTIRTFFTNNRNFLCELLVWLEIKFVCDRVLRSWPEFIECPLMRAQFFDEPRRSTATIAIRKDQYT
jgi:hypothetical protein